MNEGFICKGCGKLVLTSDKNCFFLHIRDGKIIQRLNYDSINNLSGDTRKDIMLSVSGFGNSYLQVIKYRLYQDKKVSIWEYIRLRNMSAIASGKDIYPDEKLEKEFYSLPKLYRENYSGLAAWHDDCYLVAPPDSKCSKIPSLIENLMANIDHGCKCVS